MARVDLADNAGAGNGAEAIWPGGKGYFFAEATWGGGNTKLQMKNPRGTWFDVPGTTLAANGVAAFDIPAGMIRAVTATATGVYAYAVK